MSEGLSFYYWNGSEWKKGSAKLATAPAQIRVILSNLDAVLQGKPFHAKSGGTLGSPREIAGEYRGRLSPTGGKPQSQLWISAFHPESFGALEVAVQSHRTGSNFVSAWDQLERIPELLEQVRPACARISMTPTQLRMIPSGGHPNFKCFTQVFLSGELVSEREFALARKIFPNAEVSQIYALTEVGAVMASREPWFDLKPLGEFTLQLKSGGELVVGLEGREISTGDCFESVSPNRWRFRGRKDRVFKVAGLQVFPEEIERALESHPDVQSARVKAVPSSLSSSLVEASVVLNQGSGAQATESSLIQFLSDKLARHAIPHRIQVESAPTVNASGKKKAIR